MSGGESTLRNKNRSKLTGTETAKPRKRQWKTKELSYRAEKSNHNQCHSSDRKKGKATLASLLS